MELITDALAAFRITRLLQRDTFPPIVRARDAVRSRGPDWSVELMDCPWCLGFWVSVAVIGTRAYAPRWWRRPAQALAVSAVVGVLLEGD